MENPKGELEQFYHFEGRAPVYTSRRDEEMPHICKVKLTLENSKQFEIVHRGKVKDAEKILACRALEYIREKEVQILIDMQGKSFVTEETILIKDPTVILIDLMSLPRCFFLINYIDKDSKTCVIGYTIEGSSTDIQVFLPRMQKRIVKSNKSGSVIVAMIMDLHSDNFKISGVEKKNIITLSNNKFIDAVQDLFAGDCGIKFVNFKNLQSCLHVLRSELDSS